MGGGASGVDPTATSIYEHSVKTITGEEIKLENYKGKVLLIVNVASKCGFTGQYAPLQALYEKYKDQGFYVLGFPCNNFLSQEPGTEAEIQTFCDLNYHVTFPMFEKIDCKGPTQSQLYAFLTSEKTNPQFAGKIGWNFNKFLIGRDGKILNRFGTRVSPDAKEVDDAVQAALAAPAQAGDAPPAAAAEPAAEAAPAAEPAADAAPAE
jgi:glutathione peroxidase